MAIEKNFYAVIMAGGGGTRLWPLSRKNNPKQMLSLFGGKSLFQMALDRLEDFFPPNHIFIVTIADQVDQLCAFAPHIPSANFLIEPAPRGTAAVVAMAAASIKKKDPDAVISILTADHFIKNIKGFQNILNAAYKVAQQDVLVTLGIKPEFPSTGYGYIKNGATIGEFNGVKAYKVDSFVEKPSEARAEEFLRDGNYWWNSGMFTWKVDTILNEFKNYMPELYGTINRLNPYLAIDHTNQEFVDLWTSIQPQTIDYGIMEKSTRAVVLSAIDLGWNDVGSWDSLFEVISPDLNGNIVINAKHIGMETDGSLVYSTTPGRLIVSIGMQNMIVVDTLDTVLICPRGESQKVKELVQYLKENMYTPYL